MKIQKRLVTLALAGMMTLSAFSGVLAAGVGMVDMNYLMQQHPSFTKAAATWQADVKKAQSDFASRAQNLKTDKEKQDLAREFGANLNKQRLELFTPIEKDILAKTQDVKNAKSLDCVVLKGAVVLGDAQDITPDVAQKLK
jgi:Skp family chaperone for outer membrane proteins